MRELGSEVNPAILARLGRPRTLLHLGCGAGDYGVIARRRGARVTGVEPRAELFAKAARVLDEVHRFEPSDANALDRVLTGRTFDLVLLSGALPQEKDPTSLFARVSHAVAPGGRLIYSAAEGDGAWARRAGLEVLESRPGPVVVSRKEARPGSLSLTVGMLTMDEEPSVARMIAEIRRHAPDAQILCVDSSLKDRTPIIAERLGARVLRQVPPRGHGPAMELLMYEAANLGDALIYLDCDFTYPADNLPKIRAILERGADVVNAARTRQRPEAMPLMNYLANKAFARCAEALNGLPVSDLHSGMRGYRSSVIRSFDFDGSGDALPIDTLLWPARSGYRVVEIPIEYQERVGVSKLRKLTGTVWTFIRLGRTLRVGRRGNGRYEVWPSAEAANGH